MISPEITISVKSDSKPANQSKSWFAPWASFRSVRCRRRYLSATYQSLNTQLRVRICIAFTHLTLRIYLKVRRFHLAGPSSRNGKSGHAFVIRFEVDHSCRDYK